MKTNITLALLVAIIVLQCVNARTLRLQKRAAFYIANETACVVDNIVYYNGDPIPTDDPCEACKCRPPGFACVLKECEVKPGCRAVRRTGHCCPEYVCGCEHNGRMYRDGDEIKDSQNPCYTCHCQGSAIACAFVDCFFRVDCAPDYIPGECCPRYDHCPSFGPQYNETYIKKTSEVPTSVPPTETTATSVSTEAQSDATEVPLLSNEVRNNGDKGKDENPSEEVTETEASQEHTEQPPTDKQSDEDEKHLIDPTALFYIPKDDTNPESQPIENESEENEGTSDPNEEIEDGTASENEKSAEIKTADETQESTISDDSSTSTQKPEASSDINRYDSETTDSEEQSVEESMILSEIHDVQNYASNSKADIQAPTDKETDPITKTTVPEHITSSTGTSTEVDHSSSVTTKSTLTADTTEITDATEKGELQDNTKQESKTPFEPTTMVPLPVRLYNGYLAIEKRNEENGSSRSSDATTISENDPPKDTSIPDKSTTVSLTETTVNDHSSTATTQSTTVNEQSSTGTTHSTTVNEQSNTGTTQSTTVNEQSNMTRPHSTTVNENIGKDRNEKSIDEEKKSDDETEKPESTDEPTTAATSGSTQGEYKTSTHDTTSDVTDTSKAQRSEESSDCSSKEQEESTTSEHPASTASKEEKQTTEEGPIKKLPKLNTESTMEPKTTTTHELNAASTIASSQPTDKEHNDKTTHNTQPEKTETTKGLDTTTQDTSANN